MSTTREMVKSFHEPTTTLFLSLLVAGDLAFIALHVVSSMTGREDSLVNLDVDRGYAEFYQYMKLFWICILLIYTSLRLGSKHYIAWIGLFAYLLLDDSLMIHERGGRLVAANLNLEPLFDFRMQDYGELVVSTIAGAALLGALVWTYRSGAPRFRGISQDLGLLIAMLVFFGVVADVVHAANRSLVSVKGLFEVIEEGGEMVTVSFILWYVFLLAVRPSANRWRLTDLARSILVRRSRRQAAAQR